LREQVLQQAARDELIERLAQRQPEVLRQIFVDDSFGLLNHGERGGMWLPRDEEFTSHHAPPLA
jgi:hypothetical protein